MTSKWLCPLLCGFVVATGAGCASAPTPAARASQPTTPVKAPTTANAAGDADVQCHNETLTGSHMSTRVCLTRAQREAREAAAQATRDKMTLPAADSCGGAHQMGCPN